MHQLLSILCKPLGLLASFEVLEMSEKAGGTDILTEVKELKSLALNYLVSLKWETVIQASRLVKISQRELNYSVSR